MTAHSVISEQISTDCATAFDTIHDYQNRLSWDTLLRSAHTVDDVPAAKGVVSVCTAKWRLGGLSFATRYVTFSRPRLAAVTLVKPYFIFDGWSASIRHRELDEAPEPRSEVVYTLTFTCRPRWLAPVLEPVANKAFRIETARRLRSLKHHLE